MSDSYNTRIKLKRDTEANWTRKNPVLLDGEMVIVKTTDGKTRKKIGDGTKKFSELPYDEITVDGTLSNTSANPIQNKAVKSALDSKASTSVATQSASGLMSAADKTKLDGIASGANKTDVDSSLSSESIRPVQNKAIKAALDGKLNISGGTLTGNLTGKYITGTWLQATATTNLHKTPSKIAVMDDEGWVYYRTLTEIKSDIGADTVATTSANGLMSAADKTKLDGLSGGGGMFLITTRMDEAEGCYVVDKTAEEVLNAYQSGKAIYLENANEFKIIPLSYIEKYAGYIKYFVFEIVYYSNKNNVKEAKLLRQVLTINSDGSLSNDYMGGGGVFVFQRKTT